MHSFIFLIIDLSQYSSQTISPCPTLSLHYPNIVTFHLVSGDLRDNDKKYTLEKCNVAYTPFFSALFLAMAWPEKEGKNVVLCDNAVDHLTIGSD